MPKTKFTMVPIERTDIFQELCKRLDNLLASGDFKVGDKLPSERELAESFSVSRTSIRQALKVLEASGRIETRVGSGTYFVEKQVAKKAKSNLSALLALGIDRAFMQDLIAARTAVERAVFEAYSSKVDRSGIKALKKLISDNARDTTADNEVDDNAGLDLSLEDKVAELAGNPILSALQQQVHQLWIQAWRTYGFVPEHKQTLHDEHCAIIDALASKNTQRVIDLITQHIDKEVP